MSNRLNHERQTYKHDSDRNFDDYHKYRRMTREPTIIQKKKLDYLIKKCDENGLKAVYLPENAGRTAYSGAIRTLYHAVVDAGINIDDYPTVKYKFDKNGNIVDVRTGKLVKKRK